MYLTFFKDYTEKVWGVPTDQIAADVLAIMDRVGAPLSRPVLALAVRRFARLVEAGGSGD